MESIHSSSKLKNRKVDVDSDLQKESMKVKLEDEDECSQVKSKTVFCEESELPPFPPSSPVSAETKDSASPLEQSEQTTLSERPPLVVANAIFSASHSFTQNELISVDCQLAHVK